MCGDCVLDKTAGICPVTTCPKGLLNGPCGGMWEGKCEVLRDRECAHVKIKQRLAEQGRSRAARIEAKDYSAKLKPGGVNLREDEHVSRLRDLLDRGEFVITGEVAPPHGTDYSAMLESVRKLSPVCHALNVTDNQGATLHLSFAGGFARRARQGNGCEPIFQQTCRDRNRLALQSDLLAAWTLGLENVLVVTGDDPRGGDHPKAKGVFDLDSTLLLEVDAQHERGRRHDRAPLDGGDRLLHRRGDVPRGRAVGYPARARATRRSRPGAVFFQTQAITDIDKLARAAETLRPTGAKLIAGVLLLKSPRVIKFINERLAGLMVPEDHRPHHGRREPPRRRSPSRPSRSGSREIADGVHIMPLGSDDAVERIIEDAGLS